MYLADLAPLYDLEPPVVTAYLDIPADQADAAQRLEIAWKDLVRDLGGRGVDEATIDAVAVAQTAADAGGATRLLVAAGGEVRLDRSLPAPPIAPLTTVAELPHLLPYLAWRAARRPYAVVLVDRVGADVIAYPAPDEPPAAELSGETAEWPAHKAKAGGWAAKRFDASVEESWERSAKRVADLVAQAAHDVTASVVVASGDERALSLLRDHLPTRWQERLSVVPGGGRHADGGEDLIRHRVAEVVAETAAADDVDLLARFGQAQGRDEGAADGLEPVVAALQKAQVATLIIRRDAEFADRTLAYGPQPTDLALQRADLEAMGVTGARTGPAVDALLRSAIGTGADVVEVSGGEPAGLPGGVGALLRFDLSNSGSPAA